MDKNIEDVIYQCCKMNDISQNEFYSKSRLRKIVDARTMAFYFLRNVLDYKYMELGRIFDKNHATIIHAVKKHDNMMEWDIRYKDKYQTLQYSFMDRFPDKFEGNVMFELKNENEQLKTRIAELIKTFDESNQN